MHKPAIVFVSWERGRRQAFTGSAGDGLAAEKSGVYGDILADAHLDG
jgi:hypothetical protein